MSGRETPALEWNERLGTRNGAAIAYILRHFHERLILLRAPVTHLETTARPFLEAISVTCRDIAPLTLADVAATHPPIIARAFGDIVWDWGKLQERAEDSEDDVDEGDLAAVIRGEKPKRVNPLLELTNTVAVILERRLIEPTFAEVSRGLPEGTLLPNAIKRAVFEGLALTLMHLVVFLAIGDRESAETLVPWFTFYLNGNFPIGIDEHGTFLFLTR